MPGKGFLTTLLSTVEFVGVFEAREVGRFCGKGFCAEKFVFESVDGVDADLRVQFHKIGKERDTSTTHSVGLNISGQCYARIL